MEADSNGRKLFIHKWIPDSPGALLFVLHGIFEHGGRYREVAEYLNRNGIGVIAADHYGHGRSGGRQGYIDSWDHLIDDTDRWVSQLKDQYPDIPCFIMGHSLGGLLAVSYLNKLKPDFQGVILLSAALKVSRDISPLLQAMAPVLAAMFPKLKTIRLDATAISRDREVVKDYLEDPYVYTGKIYAQTGNETLQATKGISSVGHDFKWPVLILHGTADRLTQPEGSQDFYDRIESNDKTINFYEGWYHELLNEPEKDIVFEAIRIWITSRI